MTPNKIVMVSCLGACVVLIGLGVCLIHITSAAEHLPRILVMTHQGCDALSVLGKTDLTMERIGTVCKVTGAKEVVVGIGAVTVDGVDIAIEQRIAVEKLHD